MSKIIEPTEECYSLIYMVDLLLTTKIGNVDFMKNRIAILK